MMKVIRAEKSGFCFGVKRAIESSESLLKDIGEEIVTYGKLIHNDQEVERLKKNGIIPKDELGLIKGQKVIIRTHGISEEEYHLLETQNNEIFDFTCPFVKRLQELAKKYYEEGFQVIILGKEDHPEIKGVKGWTRNTAIVVNGPADIQNLDLSQKKCCFLAQTTEKEENFLLCVEILKNKAPETVVVNTICKATQERQQAAKDLAAKVDIMVVIGGKESSNTRKLFQISKSINENTYHVERASDLDKKWFENSSIAGVSAGASTPDWIIEEVIKEMEEMKETMEMAEAVESRKSPRKGSIAQGKVVQVEKERAFVDVGGKKEGVFEINKVSLQNKDGSTQALNIAVVSNV